jgi:hypothetical protein
MTGTSEESLRQLQASPKDEFGVSHVNILFNPEADKVFVLLMLQVKILFGNIMRSLE